MEKRKTVTFTPTTPMFPNGLPNELRLTPEEEKEAEAIWCHCDEPEFGNFADDGTCDCGIHKHHYHCAICEKVYQIG